MEVDILIDKLTDCLVERSTGEQVETEYRLRTAPHNYGHLGKYEGVGGHLFAIACQISLEAGCDGVVAFTSKTSLVEYYKQALNAIEIADRRLVIFEDAAKILLNKYIKLNESGK